MNEHGNNPWIITLYKLHYINPNSKPEPDDVTLAKIFEACIYHLSFILCIKYIFFISDRKIPFKKAKYNNLFNFLTWNGWIKDRFGSLTCSSERKVETENKYCF